MGQGKPGGGLGGSWDKAAWGLGLRGREAGRWLGGSCNILMARFMVQKQRPI